jgi:SSS family solute:Na+ symporter
MQFLAIFIYLTILVAIGVRSHLKHQTSNDFILGSRKMNFWLTALAAHASDMSSWIFMAYPAVIFATGLINVWVAIGLTFFMYLNWQFIAPKLREVTEQYNSMTLPSFFESRFHDTSGNLRIWTVIISLVYYTIYISALLLGLGILIQTLFGVHYLIGVILGIIIVIPYLFIGGYVTLAWTDLFQGIFLIFTIVLVPFCALPKIGGIEGLKQAISMKSNFQKALPELSFLSLFQIFSLITSWGLGYFGMPHILTKFMGIKNVKEMPKSKWVGISWQIISLAGATLVGLISIAYFSQSGIIDDQLVFINMVRDLFSPFFAAFILCAILGTTITSMDSQILVLASNLTEDLYKKVIRKEATSKELLFVSRVSVLIVALAAFIIAVTTSSSIFSIVSYAWFGLGASFGPVVIFSLYVKKTTKQGAWAGIVSGAFISFFWPFINKFIPIEIPTLIPGFAISSFTIWVISSMTKKKTVELYEKT